MKEKPTLSDAIEMLWCAEINCDNTKKLGIGFVDMVKMQIGEAIEILKALDK